MESEQKSFWRKVLGPGLLAQFRRAFERVLGFGMHVLEGEECLCWRKGG